MKGLILTPLRRKDIIYDHYVCFLEKIRDEFKFEFLSIHK
jgi:hypothetical protein